MSSLARAEHAMTRWSVQKVGKLGEGLAIDDSNDPYLYCNPLRIDFIHGKYTFGLSSRWVLSLIIRQALQLLLELGQPHPRDNPPIPPAPAKQAHGNQGQCFAGK